jgi:hypothetical protein
LTGVDRVVKGVSVLFDYVQKQQPLQRLVQTRLGQCIIVVTNSVDNITPRALKALVAWLGLSVQSMTPDLGLRVEDLHKTSGALSVLKTVVGKERNRQTRPEAQQERKNFDQIVSAVKKGTVVSILDALGASVKVIEGAPTAGAAYLSQVSAGSQSSSQGQLVQYANNVGLFIARKFSTIAINRGNERVVPIAIQKGVAIGAVPLARHVVLPVVKNGFRLIGGITAIFMAVMFLFTRSSKSYDTTVTYPEGNGTLVNNTWSDIDQGLEYAGNWVSAPTGTLVATVVSPLFDIWQMGRKGNQTTIYTDPNRKGFNEIAQIFTKPGSLADGVLGTASELCSRKIAVINQAEQDLIQQQRRLNWRNSTIRGVCSAVVPACALATRAPALGLSIVLDFTVDVVSLSSNQVSFLIGYNTTSKTKAPSRMRYLSVHPLCGWVPSTYNIALIVMVTLLGRAYVKSARALSDDSEEQTGDQSPKTQMIRKIANLIKEFQPDFIRYKKYHDASNFKRVLMCLQMDRLLVPLGLMAN